MLCSIWNTQYILNHKFKSYYLNEKFSKQYNKPVNAILFIPIQLKLINIVDVFAYS